jgi:Mg-chelatase subunit ChlD
MSNNLELNKGDQFIFAIDVSASMGSTDTPSGQSRIEFAKEQTKTFISEASKYDEDGVDVLTFGHQVIHLGALTAEKANEVVTGLKANEGRTDTAGVLAKAFELANAKRQAGETNNIVVFVITDGEPNDREAVKQVIRKQAETQANGEDLGIVFLTVGVIDSGLQSFLTELDDTLNAKFDIVDVKALHEVNFVEAFLGAVHD